MIPRIFQDSVLYSSHRKTCSKFNKAQNVDLPRGNAFSCFEHCSSLCKRCCLSSGHCCPRFKNDRNGADLEYASNVSEAQVFLDFLGQNPCSFAAEPWFGKCPRSEDKPRFDVEWTVSSDAVVLLLCLCSLVTPRTTVLSAYCTLLDTGLPW